MPLECKNLTIDCFGFANCFATLSQMTHSIDSFITDSANSATALFTGKKSSVSALNVWADSVSVPVTCYSSQKGMGRLTKRVVTELV